MQFATYITFYSGKLLPMWYIGSSSVTKVRNGYNGSIKSKKYITLYKSEQKNNKHLFKSRILSTHTTRKEALTEELRVQKLHDVVKNKNYMNESYASINGYFGRDVSGELNPNYGNSWDDQQRKHLSDIQKIKMQGSGNNNYGNKWTQLQKDTMSKCKKSLNLTPHNVKYYNVYDKEDNLVYSDITGTVCRKLHKNLPFTTKINSIKLTPGLKRFNKEFMIGWYTEVKNEENNV